MNTIILSFTFFLIIFTLVGVLSTFSSKKTTEDYLLAGNNIKPWLAALSAVATNNSGYMFIGMIGYTYIYGFSSIWLMLGWVLGDFFASLFVHKKIIEMSKKTKSLSFSELLGRWQFCLGHSNLEMSNSEQKRDFRSVRFLAALITVLFLGVYAAAQLKAGSKALHVLFEWDISVGAIIGAIMVVLYCFAGGIRASIWTDAAQSFVMLVAMFLIAYKGILSVGGFDMFFQNLENISDSYTSFIPAETQSLGVFLTIFFIAGWFFGGIAIIGQPHIMVRYMTLSSAKQLKETRYYYYSWYLIFFMLTIFSGLVARVVLPVVSNFDAELALPKVALELLPNAYVGLILAGLFAATMSTADSQILSCTAAITRDLISRDKASYFTTKLVTLLITCFALLIALFADGNVFNLVLIAWSGLGACFAPILIAYSFNYKIKTEVSPFLSMLAGLLMIILWRHHGLSAYTYEVFPGILFGLLVLFGTDRIYCMLFEDKSRV